MFVSIDVDTIAIPKSAKPENVEFKQVKIFLVVLLDLFLGVGVIP